jgi:hypothetical protein
MMTSLYDLFMALTIILTFQGGLSHSFTQIISWKQGEK